MAEDATYRLHCHVTFRCPCKRQLEKRYLWDVVICTCGNVWGEEEQDTERIRKNRRKR